MCKTECCFCCTLMVSDSWQSIIYNSKHIVVGTMFILVHRFWGHVMQPVHVHIHLIWLTCTKRQKYLCQNTKDYHKIQYYLHRGLFSLLSKTLSEHTCAPFLGHNPRDSPALNSQHCLSIIHVMLHSSPPWKFVFMNWEAIITTSGGSESFFLEQDGNVAFLQKIQQHFLTLLQQNDAHQVCFCVFFMKVLWI